MQKTDRHPTHHGIEHFEVQNSNGGNKDDSMRRPAKGSFPRDALAGS